MIANNQYEITWSLECGLFSSMIGSVFTKDVEEIVESFSYKNDSIYI